MIFNGIEVYEAMYDKYKFIGPRLEVGNKIRLLYDDTSIKCPGCRALKKGVYNVTNVRQGVGKYTVYELVKDTKNSKYKHVYSQIAIDKAIQSTLIEIV
jgi:hypothetical protein